MSVSEMGRRSGLPKSTTNRLVGGLEGLGAPRGGYGIRLAAANSRRGRRRLQRARMSSVGSLCGCANRPSGPAAC